MTTKFSKLAFLSVAGTDVTQHSANVPQIGKDVVTQSLTTGNAEGTSIGGELEDNSFMFSLYNDDADVVGSLIRPLHKKNVAIQVQYGDPTTPGTPGTAKRDDIRYDFEIFLVVPTPVPAGTVGSAEMWDLQAKIQGVVTENDGT